MRIKEQYTRNDLEGLSVHRIKRMFRIPRQAKYTKMRLIEKVMEKMDEIYPIPLDHMPNVSSEIFIPDRPLQSTVTVSLWGIGKKPIPSREELQNIRWQTLMKMYSIKPSQGINKQTSIEKILNGTYTLDKNYIENEM